jgi:hypothetical protein
MAENIGAIFPTKIPGLEETADIQEALKIYHYGSKTYDTANTDKTLLLNPSMAHNLKVLEEEIDVLQNNGIGSGYIETRPTDVPNGFIWVDSASAGAVEAVLPNVFYQNEEPTSGLVEGRLWVDKDSSPLTMYVYDSSLGWRQIGGS